LDENDLDGNTISSQSDNTVVASAITGNSAGSGLLESTTVPTLDIPTTLPAQASEAVESMEPVESAGSTREICS